MTSNKAETTVTYPSNAYDETPVTVLDGVEFAEQQTLQGLPRILEHCAICLWQTQPEVTRRESTLTGLNSQLATNISDRTTHGLVTVIRTLVHIESRMRFQHILICSACVVCTLARNQSESKTKKTETRFLGKGFGAHQGCRLRDRKVVRSNSH